MKKPAKKEPEGPKPRSEQSVINSIGKALQALPSRESQRRVLDTVFGRFEDKMYTTLERKVDPRQLDWTRDAG